MTVLLSVSGILLSGAEPVDTTEHLNAVQRVIRYFEESNRPVPTDGSLSWGFIGGPFYSSDTHFGLGLVAAAQYRTHSDTLAPPSHASLKLQGSTTLFYSIGLSGMHSFPDDRLRLVYNVDFQSMPTWFWGIGYDAGRDDEHKTKYTDRRINLRVDALARVAGPLFLGGLVQGSYVHAANIRQPEIFDGLSNHVTDFALGLCIVYDTRDVPTEAHSGWNLALCQKIWPKWLGNTSHSFSSTEFEASFYHQVWRGGVLASRFKTVCTIGETPWALMPTFGGSTAMRGYYLGQYRDKCEFDLTAELRQRVWRRSGAVVWAGFGTVFPYISALRWKKLLPNVGVGYRWEFKERINVRLDVGFGRGCYGIEFGINEAF